MAPDPEIDRERRPPVLLTAWPEGRSVGGRSTRGGPDFVLVATLVAALCSGATAGSQPAAPARAEDRLPPGAVREIHDLIDRGFYREAETAARSLFARIAPVNGEDSLDAAEAIDLLVAASWRAGTMTDPRIRALAERALRTKEARYGDDHLEVAVSLSNLGNVLSWIAENEEAQRLFERALTIRERALGPDHPDVADSLEELGSELIGTPRGKEAGPLLERAIAIRERRFGPDDPRVARALAQLARIVGNEQPARARQLYERALAIQRGSLGTEHPDMAVTLKFYGSLEWVLGDYAAARAREEESLAILETRLGPDHPQSLSALGLLGVVLWHQGDYAAARPCFERALAGAERVFGPDSIDVAFKLNRLGLFHHYLGDYAVAQALQERSLRIREMRLGPESLEVAASLNNLALVFTDLGEYDHARVLAERAVAIYEKAGSTDDPTYPIVVDTIGALLHKMGDPRAARPVFEKAIGIWEKKAELDPYNMAHDLEGLAEVLMDLGETGAAGPFFERALAMREKTLGPNHRDVAETLCGLARLHLLSGDRKGALDAALRAEAIARASFRATARSLVEREALQYEAIRSSGLDVALSVLSFGGPSDRTSDRVRRVWDELTRSRGMVLDEMASRHRAVIGGEDATVAALAKDLEQARNRLARLMVEGPDAAGAEEYRRRLAAAQDEKETAERALADKSDSFRRELMGAQIGLAEVERALPEENALVSFVYYQHQIPPGAKPPGAGGSLRVVPSYLALVLGPGVRGPVAVPLGSARRIEPLIRRWREEVARVPQGLSLGGGTAEERYRQAGADLRHAVWDPVAGRVGQARAVFVVPDGALNLVSLATLPVGPDRYLVERGPRLHYLSSEREIVRRDSHPAARGGLLLVGGVDFDARPRLLTRHAGRSALDGETVSPDAGEAPAPSAPGRLDLAAGTGTRRAACADFRSLTFKPLPSSRAEVDDIASLWIGSAAGVGRDRGSVQKLTGDRADKETFKKSVAGYRIVHLATHGFFAEDHCASALERARGGGRDRDSARAGPGPGEDPLLLTGLALAGANRRETRGTTDDGLLTAEEISSLDLSSAEWAVLSACETGVGKVQAGEGVLGLRRAFEVAGAGTLILSLWSVEDAAAREWMAELYGGRLKGLSTADAVSQASRRVIDRRRRAGLSAHPAAWGAFVATGDWR